MQQNDEVSSKELIQRAQKSNAGSLLTGTSATISAILVPIIITMLNQISTASNSVVVIALSVICCTTIVCTAIGVVKMRTGKDAASALNKDLDDIEKIINEHFERRGDDIVLKEGASFDSITKKIPKKMVRKQ